MTDEVSGISNEVSVQTKAEVWTRGRIMDGCDAWPACGPPHGRARFRRVRAGFMTPIMTLTYRLREGGLKQTQGESKPRVSKPTASHRSPRPVREYFELILRLTISAIALINNEFHSCDMRLVRHFCLITFLSRPAERNTLKIVSKKMLMWSNVNLFLTY